MREDALLIRRMKGGDDDAIEEFVRKYYPQILRYCRLHSPDLHSAEDMTQETFLRFFRSLPKYQHYGKAINYWISIFVYSFLTLSYLGFDGWDCPIQITNWKSIYHLTYGEFYLLILMGGYLANLFISFLVMWVSAKTRTSLLAVTIPFVVCFLPVFLQDFEDAKIIGKLLSFLPDRLLTVSYAVSYLDLLSIGKTVVAGLPVCFLLYSILTFLLVPAMYQEFRHKQIK